MATTHNYGIDDGHSNQLRCGLWTPDQAREIAQEVADARGEAVWLYKLRDANPSEKFEPNARGEVIIYISNDYSTLGPDATREDLERYCANLAEHLSEHFDATVSVTPTSTLDVVCSHIDVREYVRGLQSGDGWLAFVEVDKPTEDA